jgi:hypothetical protein
MMRWVSVWLFAMLLSASNPMSLLSTPTPTPTPLPRHDPANRAIRMLAPVELPDTAFVNQDGELVKRELGARKRRVVCVCGR